MLITEIVEQTPRYTIKHTYSNTHKMIRQLETGQLYEDAVDTRPYNYEETDIDISDYEAVN